ncbi:MAG: methionyl-tRNA formyltransferase, partial [Proteobacteria bacterium]|nr:methionyl-tRNA formyltransferase [Pseudomonadota bacterium]
AKPAAEVHNTIRAADPAPGASATIAGVKLDLFEPQRVEGQNGAAGTILAIDDKGMVVAAQGGAVRIRRVRAPGGKKVAPAEWAKGAGIAAGARFEAPAPKSA